MYGVLLPLNETGMYDVMQIVTVLVLVHVLAFAVRV